MLCNAYTQVGAGAPVKCRCIWTLRFPPWLPQRAGVIPRSLETKDSSFWVYNHTVPDSIRIIEQQIAESNNQDGSPYWDLDERMYGSPGGESSAHRAYKREIRNGYSPTITQSLISFEYQKARQGLLNYQMLEYMKRYRDLASEGYSKTDDVSGRWNALTIMGTDSKPSVNYESYWLDQIDSGHPSHPAGNTNAILQIKQQGTGYIGVSHHFKMTLLNPKVAYIRIANGELFMLRVMATNRSTSVRNTTPSSSMMSSEKSRECDRMMADLKRGIHVDFSKMDMIMKKCVYDR